MDFSNVTAGKDDNDRRIDKVIRKFLSQENLSSLYKTMRKGLIKLNDKKCEPGTHVFEGDKISVASFLLSSKNRNEKLINGSQNVTKESLDIVFANEHILVINKPYDKTVHGFDNSLDKQVQDYYLKNNKITSISFMPGPLHRLDRKTTGLLAFSWDLQGARWFSQNIANHSISKIYHAVLTGHLNKTEEWIDYIQKEDNDKEKKSFHTVKVMSDSENIDLIAKKAVTKVEPVYYGNYNGTDFTYARIYLFTGRTHQIRSQAASHGYVLLGDSAYGSKVKLQDQEYFLHASILKFGSDNPLDLPMEIKAPEPKAFVDFLEKHRY